MIIIIISGFEFDLYVGFVVFLIDNKFIDCQLILRVSPCIAMYDAYIKTMMPQYYYSSAVFDVTG